MKQHIGPTPRCPYCDVASSAWENDDGIYDGINVEWTCPNCDKQYNIYPMIFTRFISSKLGEDDD